MKDYSLRTARLYLRMPQLTDCGALFQGYINQPEHCYHQNSKPLSLPQLQKYVEEKRRQIEEGSSLLWLITLPDDTLIGEIQLRFYSHNHSAELWYSLDSNYQKQGYMTEALCAVRDYALQHLKIRRLQAACIRENLPSKAVLNKCGFQYEGCLRAYVLLCDGYHDMELYSILPQ